MKILHLADLHLGKLVSGLSMIDDQRYVLDEAIRLCKKEGVKHIIISGDVYDRSIPPEDAVSVLNDFLSTCIIDEKINVYMISGNHDSKERLSCFNEILQRQGLFIDSEINKDLSMNKHVIKEDDLVVNIYSLPYLFPGEIRLLSGDENVKDFEKAVQKVLENNKINENEINICATHYFVSGGSLDVIRSGSESKTSVGTIEQISYRLFDKFDYVALGHLHCPQHVGRDTVRYAGSPLRYSIDEINQNKCFTIIDIKNKGDIQVNKIDIVPLREFIKLTGTVDELTVNSEIKDNRIIYFELTDNRHVINAAARLKIKYPYYVGLDYINVKSGFDEDEGQLTKVEGFDDLTTDEQFSKFFSFLMDKELDDIQKEVVKSIVEELKEDE